MSKVRAFPLICPSCAAPLDSALAVCVGCKRTTPFRDGVWDYVQQDRATQLEDLDYDSHYAIDDAKIDATFRDVHQRAGAVLDRVYGTVLELGAGTGMFTSSLARHVTFERAIITDISKKMLDVCRRRVEAVKRPGQEWIFATNRGVELHLAEGVADLALVVSALHHVLDYKATLRSLVAATSNEGIALLVEPNRRFHQVGALILREVVLRTQTTPWPGLDLSHLTNLLYEWHFNLKFSGDAEVLAAREDKHIFEPEELRREALAAGWGEVDVFGFGSRAPVVEYVKDALGARMTEDGLQRLDLECSRSADPYEQMRGELDTVSNVYVLRKSGTTRVAAKSNTRRSPRAASHLRCDLQLTLLQEELHVSGWIVSDQRLHSVQVQCGAERVVAPVGRVRSDVHAVFAADPVLPDEHTFFCGIDERLPFAAHGAVSVEAVFEHSPSVALGKHLLPVDGTLNVAR